MLGFLRSSLVIGFGALVPLPGAWGGGGLGGGGGGSESLEDTLSASLLPNDAVSFDQAESTSPHDGPSPKKRVKSPLPPK